MPTFGNTNAEGTTQDIADRIQGTRFTCPEACIADSITVYLGWGIDQVRCAIYDTSNNLVGQTEERSLDWNAAPAWFTFNFLSPKPKLLGNTDYYLVVWGDTDVNSFLTYYGGPGTSSYQTRDYDGGNYPDTWSPTSEDSRLYSIYCTYTALAEVTKTHTVKL